MAMKAIPPGGIMVAPVVIPAFTVQVKDLGPPGLPPDPSKIRQRDEREERKHSEEEQKIKAQEQAKTRREEEAFAKSKTGCKVKKDRFCPGRPDLWKCVNNNGINNGGDGPNCPPSNSRQTVNNGQTDNRTRRSNGPTYRTYRPGGDEPTRSRAGLTSLQAPFSKMRESDNLSFATTDTHKLLAMLKESEGEIEGLSFSSSMKASSAKGSAESIFEPLKNSRKGGYMRVVRKKPSPDPITRLEKRWSKRSEVRVPDSLPDSPRHEQQQSGGGRGSPTQPKPLDENWWNKSDVNWREAQRSKHRSNCATRGYGAGHNADFLPAIAHLSQLGKLNSNFNPVAMTQGILKRNPQVQPWNPETQNYFAQETTSQKNTNGQKNKSGNNKQQQFGQKESRRTGKKAVRASQSRTARHGASSRSPTEGDWNQRLLLDDPKPPQPFVSNVFVRDMTKTRNANLARVPRMKVIQKVLGDPSVIKQTTAGRSASQSCTPPSMEASDLMALEENINETEQQEDAKRLALFLSADLKNQIFTDVIIKCKDHVYKIHKEFLLAFTTYDIPVITGEPLRDFPTLDLSDLDSSDVATVLHFLYYGELKLSVYNILGVQTTAIALGVVDISPIIQEFHNKLFNPPNLINIIEFAQGKKIEDLYKNSWKFFVAAFYDHVNGGHFLNWETSWVLNLLEHQDIPIKSELEVFEAARLWLNHRPDERTDCVKSVLTTVRWTYMTPEEMVECEREDPTLMSRREAHELVSDANWYKIMIRNGVPWTDFNIPPPRGNPKNPGKMNRLQRSQTAEFGAAVGSTDDDACAYVPATSFQFSRFTELTQKKSSALSEFMSRNDLFDDSETFSEASFNSLDVDASNVSFAEDERRE